MSHNRISQQEVESLPHWAKLALASRCVRRARLLISPPSAQSAVLDQLLARLDEATGTATAGDELAEAAAAAYMLALDNVDAGDEDSSVVTCMVAHAAAFAAEAATLTDAKQSAHLVAQSVDFAIHGCRLAMGTNAEAAVVAMRADFERLRDGAATWGDHTALPKGCFPSL